MTDNIIFQLNNFYFKIFHLATDENAENDFEGSQDQFNQPPAQSSSVAVAGQQGIDEEENSYETYDQQEENVQSPESDESEQEVSAPKSKAKPRGSSGGISYFPINFGGNPGVVAIANSYSTGKGEIWTRSGHFYCFPIFIVVKI